jgi:hypothetical protein
MYKLSLLALALFSSISVAQDTKVGYTGTLSSLDGGLGGTVHVVDPNTLMITGYTLKDASAPALYWWGTTDGTIKDGFRISNEQVTSAATTDSLTIKLDAGKTSSDFTTVGLWCERLNANFGQATLKAGDGSTPTTNSSSSTTIGGSTSASASKKSAANSNARSYGVMVGIFAAAVGFAVAM